MSDFDKLHSRKADTSATLLAFDVLQLEGIDPRGLQLVEHLEGDGATIFAHACRMGLEGIVSKRADAPHRSGQSRMWLKIKNRDHPSVARIKAAIESGTFRRR